MCSMTVILLTDASALRSLLPEPVSPVYFQSFGLGPEFFFHTAVSLMKGN